LPMSKPSAPLTIAATTAIASQIRCTRVLELGGPDGGPQVPPRVGCVLQGAPGGAANPDGDMGCGAANDGRAGSGLPGSGVLSALMANLFRRALHHTYRKIYAVPGRMVYLADRSGAVAAGPDLPAGPGPSACAKMGEWLTG
jgi:hypothetical protein